jgi:hypothetical protein
MRMSALICQILGVVAVTAMLFLAGCNFGGDNAGDVYGSSAPAQTLGEHTVPESQKSGTVTGEPAPDRTRLGQ